MSSTIADPRADAMKYLNEHKVLRLFDILGAKIAYLKPEDPNAFIVSELNKISAMMSRNQHVTLFTEQDLEIMYGVFDITSRGFLTQDQYTSALLAVGVDSPALSKPFGDRIDKKAFVKHLMAEVTHNAF